MTTIKYYCKTKCYFRDYLWAVGEVMEADQNEKVPEHFTDKPIPPDTDIHRLPWEPRGKREVAHDPRLPRDMNTMSEFNTAEHPNEKTVTEKTALSQVGKAKGRR